MSTLAQRSAGAWPRSHSDPTSGVPLLSASMAHEYESALESITCAAYTWANPQPAQGRTVLGVQTWGSARLQGTQCKTSDRKVEDSDFENVLITRREDGYSLSMNKVLFSDAVSLNSPNNPYEKGIFN